MKAVGFFPQNSVFEGANNGRQFAFFFGRCNCRNRIREMTQSDLMLLSAQPICCGIQKRDGVSGLRCHIRLFFKRYGLWCDEKEYGFFHVTFLSRDLVTDAASFN